VSRDAKDVALSVAILDFWTNSIPANQILLGERGIPASSVVADGIAPMLDETNQKVIAYINNVVSPNCSDLPAADPAASAELYKVIVEMQEYLLYGQVTAEEAAQQVMDAAASIL
jgi:multiple sugar transport system substrate-binding protein